MAGVNDNPAQPSSTSRFPSTGDQHVDRALAQLPDPQVHRHAASVLRSEGDPVDAESTPEADAETSRTKGSLPDPALLDQHLGDVTTVHRLLQQRLSDLSG